MGWLDFEAEVFDDAILRGLDVWEQGFASFKVPLRDAAERIAGSIDEGLERGGVPDPFDPLAPSTLYATASYRLGGPLLKTGLLAATVADITGSKAGSAWSLSDNEAHVGLDENTEIGKIGAILQSGYDFTDNNGVHRKMPARVFVRVLGSDVDFTTERFGDYTDELLFRAFPPGASAALW